MRTLRSEVCHGVLIRSPQIAAYIVDYDLGFPTHVGLGRQSTVALLDRATLNAAAPVQFVSTDQTAGGVWLVFQTNQSVRLRFSQLIGDNAVVSALAFDEVLAQKVTNAAA